MAWNSSYYFSVKSLVLILYFGYIICSWGETAEGYVGLHCTAFMIFCMISKISKRKKKQQYLSSCHLATLPSSLNTLVGKCKYMCCVHWRVCHNHVFFHDHQNCLWVLLEPSTKFSADWYKLTGTWDSSSSFQGVLARFAWGLGERVLWL